jgi:hypothetical protein
MTETLESVKDRISNRYLGKAGIHAVGVRRSTNAIMVYVQPTGDATQQWALECLRKDASPYKVVTRDAVPAKLA